MNDIYCSCNKSHILRKKHYKNNASVYYQELGLGSLIQILHLLSTLYYLNSEVIKYRKLVQLVEFDVQLMCRKL